MEIKTFKIVLGILSVIMLLCTVAVSTVIPHQPDVITLRDVVYAAGVPIWGIQVLSIIVRND